MKQYLNFTKTKTSYSFKHNIGVIFKKVEALFFGFLCVIFLIASKLNDDFSKDVSFAFVSVSLPIVKIAAFPFNTAINLVVNFQELIEAKKENERLKEELTRLQSFYLKSLNIYHENAELQNVLNFISAKSSSFKVAKIIGISDQLFNQNIFIDAGKSRGIKKGSLVTGNHGAIGRIIEVDENKSRLALLTDAISRIPIISSKARIKGILVGNNSDLMEIIFLPKNHKIAAGDLIFTSGDGDSLPSGILLGKVVEVKKSRVFVAMIENIGISNMVTILDY